MRLAMVAVLGLLAVLVFAPVAQAKGPPIRVRVTGPNLPRDIEITDARLLAAFAPGTLERGTPLPPATGPEGATLAYLITRYYGAELFDQVRYVPDGEGSGQLFAEGIMYQRFVMQGVEWQPRSPGVVGHWWIPLPETEHMIQQLLADPPASPDPVTAGPRLADLVPWLPLLALGLGGLLIGRARHRAPAQ